MIAPGRGGVKDVKEIESRKQRAADAEKEKSGWNPIGGGSAPMETPEPKQEKEKKQPTAFDGSIFGRGGKTSGPPKFSSGGRSKAVNGGINTGDFPAMGDFPTIGQAEQKNAPAHQNKADMSGSYQSMAKDPNADPSVGSGISFSKGGPPMFTSSKKKNNDPTKRAEEAQGV